MTLIYLLEKFCLVRYSRIQSYTMADAPDCIHPYTYQTKQLLGFDRNGSYLDPHKNKMSSFQIFSKPDCSCQCPDLLKRSSCSTEDGLRYWDESTCQCLCSKDSFDICQDGYVFDFHSSCRYVIVTWQVSTAQNEGGYTIKRIYFDGTTILRAFL
jgi:hypothetical protein